VKPQSAGLRLDGGDASPHPEAMVKSDDKTKPAPSQREAKLAQALRANLRRRKAGGVATAGEAAKKGSEKSD